MTILVTHNFAHRLLFNRIMESAPVLKMNQGALEIDQKQWAQRQPDSMDMSGGDYELVKSMLKQLTFVFPANLRRTPQADATEPEVVEAQTVL